MIVGTIIQRIQSDYSKGIPSSAIRLSRRHIYNKMTTVRARLLSQQAKRDIKISQWNYQPLNFIEFEAVPATLAPCACPKGMTILRSKKKLPRPLTDYGQHLIQSITTTDGGESLHLGRWSEAKYASSDKYTGKNAYLWILDGYLYMFQPIREKAPAALTAVGLWGDPIEATNGFENCCGISNSCVSNMDRDFYLDEEMVEGLVELCQKELIDDFTRAKQDRTANGRDDTAAPQK